MTPDVVTKESFNSRMHNTHATRKRLMSNSLDYSRMKVSAALMTVAILVLLATGLAVPALASAEETSAQQVFPSPAAAAAALVAAAKANDMKTLSAILGPDADQLLSSGDPVADTNARDNFVRRYQEMNRLAYDDEGRVILYIGPENWPVPIPLVQKNGGWVFDTAAGKDELLYRRIGDNELFTIRV